MQILDEAAKMLQKYTLCDNCLGRQFALLGYSLENSQRGRAVKLSLVLQATAAAQSKVDSTGKTLKLLATRGFSAEAQNTLHHLKKRLPKTEATHCFLCNDRFLHLDDLLQKALKKLEPYEYATFLVGIELPVAVGRYATSRYSLVELLPLSGRRHQLRRHLKHLLHPLIGDTRYGEGRHNRFFRETLHCRRLLLHAVELAFPHPATGALTTVTAPLQDDFARVVERFDWWDAIPKQWGLPGK